jgi:hypothetical protein
MGFPGAGDARSIEMSTEKKAENLIQYYVDEVGRRLPRRKRADIQMEILSFLQDALEDRAEAAGRQPDEEMVVELLKEYGPPAKMAASYKPQNYLIGPEVFPVFIAILVIVLGAQLLSFLVGNIVQFNGLVSNPIQALTALGQSGLALFNEWLGSLGMLALVFFLIEWALPDSDDKAKNIARGRLQALHKVPEAFGILPPSDDDWDPKELKKVEKADQIQIGESIFEMIGLIFVLVLFNAFPQWVGAIGIINGIATGSSGTFVPILSAAFLTYLPWLDIYWAGSFGLAVYQLREGRKTTATRWARLGLKAFGLLILVMILTGPSILGLNPDYVAFHGTTLEVQQTFSQEILSVLQIVLTLILGINLIVHTIALLYGVIKLVVGRTRAVVKVMNRG